MNLEQRLALIHPHPRQIAWQETEFYAFVHFTVNTFTDKEWGDGTESPEIFNPIDFDAHQWVAAIKSAGMRGLILTCKHHDGFCLWHSKLTRHTVEYSPFKRDIVKETADACREGGIKFGVYLSPWDRNSQLYGSGKPYDDYFCGQLEELLTNYGEVFSVWFDGACGEGPNGKKQYYDWERYYSVIRRLQPNACISVCGPDVRWCGNEAGYTRPSEWSVVPLRTKDTEKVASLSQHEDSDEFRQRKIFAWDQDLGSRELLENEPDLIWYPAETNTSIRPGWFYHEYEDDKVRSLDDLMNVYYNSVGGNTAFLLNIPPARNGLFHPNDVARLKEIGDTLRKAFAVNLADNASLSALSEAEGCTAENLRKDSYEACWMPKTKQNAELTFEWSKPMKVGNIVIKENIPTGQRIEKFVIETRCGDDYKKAFQGTVIGHKRIVRLNEPADGIRIRFTQSRCEPMISFIGIYEG